MPPTKQRAKEDEERLKRLRAMARQKEKEEMEVERKRLEGEDTSIKTDSIDKKHLIAAAKVSMNDLDMCEWRDWAHQLTNPLK
jgi:hypothetical protein